MEDFCDQVVLVTGGTRGLGRAMAVAFAAAGASVAIVGTDAERSRQAAAEIAAQAGQKVLGFAARVEDFAAVEAVVGEVLAAFGKIDVLINNAGITRDNLLLRLKEEDWDAVLGVNLKGVFNFTKVVSRSMLKAKYGRIVNISSVVGLFGNAGQSNYAAAKAGIIGFSKSVARELASRSITVNVIAPGYMETEMTAALPPAAQQELQQRIPLGQTGKPEDVARAALFLAAREANYITGQVLCVDGGLAM